jgi:hypothetical protein
MQCLTSFLMTSRFQREEVSDATDVGSGDETVGSGDGDGDDVEEGSGKKPKGRRCPAYVFRFFTLSFHAIVILCLATERGRLSHLSGVL